MKSTWVIRATSTPERLNSCLAAWCGEDINFTFMEGEWNFQVYSIKDLPFPVKEDEDARKKYFAISIIILLYYRLAAKQQ